MSKKERNPPPPSYGHRPPAPPGPPIDPAKVKLPTGTVVKPAVHEPIEVPSTVEIGRAGMVIRKAFQDAGRAPDNARERIAELEAELESARGEVELMEKIRAVVASSAVYVNIGRRVSDLLTEDAPDPGDSHE